MTTTAPTLVLPAVTERRLGWTEVLLTPVGFVAANVVTGIGLFSTGLLTDPVAGLVASLFATSLLAGLLLALRVRSTAPLRLQRTGVRWLLGGVAAGLVAKAASIPLVFAWIALTGETWNPQQGIFDAAVSGGWRVPVVIALGGLLIPVAEEVLFRGVLFAALRRHGATAAVLGSAAVFALFHVVPVVMIVAVVLGVVGGVVRERSGSLWPAIACHVAFNLSTFALAFLI